MSEPALPRMAAERPEPVSDPAPLPASQACVAQSPEISGNPAALAGDARDGKAVAPGDPEALETSPNIALIYALMALALAAAIALAYRITWPFFHRK